MRSTLSTEALSAPFLPDTSAAEALLRGLSAGFAEGFEGACAQQTHPSAQEDLCVLLEVQMAALQKMFADAGACFCMRFLAASAFHADPDPNVPSSSSSFASSSLSLSLSLSLPLFVPDGCIEFPMQHTVLAAHGSALQTKTVLTNHGGNAAQSVTCPFCLMLVPTCSYTRADSLKLFSGFCRSGFCQFI